ncbi:MAG: hypothetical protein O9302_00500 [Cyclobacteriaceae bacterium]|jgi:hypothetical protein|nr:hypothetical protein [Flammeovirgaceae bacterium]MCZ8021244.1 hypothetical protein [Cytophagales bacterium]MCZ8326510.1 hypothetical protein [Cyclobacteriaceae bacterium]MCZ8353989.1 hypothetical protein [Cyclobacteriaceae bacterium]
MKTIMLLIVLVIASLQVNAQKSDKKSYTITFEAQANKKPLLACEDSFSAWLKKSNRNTHQLIASFQPLTELFVPVKNVSSDLSPSIKLVTLNAKNYE